MACWPLILALPEPGIATQERHPTRLSKAIHSAMYAWKGLLVSIKVLYGVAATIEETISASPIHSLNPSARHQTASSTVCT